MIAETAERYLRDRYPIEVRQANVAREAGYNPDQWAEMAELGLLAALLPPEAGGLGGAGADIALVFEALGRRGVVEPFLATGILGATPLWRQSDGATGADLGALIEGRRTLAFAHGEPEGRYTPSYVATKAERERDIWRLTGRKAVVLNGDSADRLVVSARIDGPVDAEAGLGLFLLDPDAAGVTRRGYGTVEGGRAAEITLAGARATPLGQPGKAFPVIEETLARAALALSAEALGLAEAAKEMTLDYLKARRQFGREIGAFQALQHRMVEIVLEIEQLRSAVMLAAARLEADRRTRERLVSAAKNLAGRVGQRVAEESIQLHGGIAMTWDYALPHLAKRLVMIDHLCGDADHHLLRFRSLSATEHG